MAPDLGPLLAVARGQLPLYLVSSIYISSVYISSVYNIYISTHQVFLLLTRDCVRAHKISGHNKNAQFGGLLFSLDLVLVTDVRYVERRGYLTLCVEGQVSGEL